MRQVLYKIFVLLGILLSYKQADCLSDLRLCADSKCKGTSTIRYTPINKGMVSFQTNSKLRIMSKSAGSDPSLWGIQVNGRTGYAPKDFIRETKIFIKDSDLKYIVPVETEDNTVTAATVETKSTPSTVVDTANLKTSEPVPIDSKPDSETVPVTTSPLESAKSADQLSSVVTDSDTLKKEELSSTPVQAATVQRKTEMIDGTEIPILDDMPTMNSDRDDDDEDNDDDDDDDDDGDDYDDDEYDSYDNDKAHVQPEREQQWTNGKKVTSKPDSTVPNEHAAKEEASVISTPVPPQGATKETTSTTPIVSTELKDSAETVSSTHSSIERGNNAALSSTRNDGGKNISEQQIDIQANPAEKIAETKKNDIKSEGSLLSATMDSTTAPPVKVSVDTASSTHPWNERGNNAAVDVNVNQEAKNVTEQQQDEQTYPVDAVKIEKQGVAGQVKTSDLKSEVPLRSTTMTVSPVTESEEAVSSTHPWNERENNAANVNGDAKNGTQQQTHPDKVANVEDQATVNEVRNSDVKSVNHLVPATMDSTTVRPVKASQESASTQPSNEPRNNPAVDVNANEEAKNVTKQQQDEQTNPADAGKIKEQAVADQVVKSDVKFGVPLESATMDSITVSPIKEFVEVASPTQRVNVNVNGETKNVAEQQQDGQTNPAGIAKVEEQPMADGQVEKSDVKSEGQTEVAVNTSTPIVEAGVPVHNHDSQIFLLQKDQVPQTQNISSKIESNADLKQERVAEGTDTFKSESTTIIHEETSPTRLEKTELNNEVKYQEGNVAPAREVSIANENEKNNIKVSGVNPSTKLTQTQTTDNETVKGGFETKENVAELRQEKQTSENFNTEFNQVVTPAPTSNVVTESGFHYHERNHPLHEDDYLLHTTTANPMQNANTPSLPTKLQPSDDLRSYDKIDIVSSSSEIPFAEETIQQTDYQHSNQQYDDSSQSQLGTLFAPDSKREVEDYPYHNHESIATEQQNHAEIEEQEINTEEHLHVPHGEEPNTFLPPEQATPETLEVITKKAKGLFSIIMATVNSIMPAGKKEPVYHNNEDLELNRILFPEGTPLIAAPNDDDYCEKLSPNSDCPLKKGLKYPQSHHGGGECSCTSANESIAIYVEVLLSKLLEMTDLLACLGIAAAASLVFIFGYYCFCNSSREGALLERLNMLERSLLAAQKEGVILKHDLLSTRNKLLCIEDTSFGSNDMVVALKKELEDEMLNNEKLKNEINTLEKELDNATEAGLELNKIVSDLLSNQNGDESIISSVEELQIQLNEQQKTILDINATLADKSRENSELQLMVAEQNARLGGQIASLQQDNDELEAEKGQLVTRVDEMRAEFDEEITKALEGKNFEIKRLQNDIVDLKTKCEDEHTKRQTSQAKIEALEECLRTVKRDPNVNIAKMIDVANVKAEMLDAQRKHAGLKDKLDTESDARRLAEEKFTASTVEVEKLKQNFHQAEKDKLEAQTRLEVLSNYFKDKETQLQKELSLKDAMWLQQQGEAVSTVDRLTTLQNEIQSLKSQNDSLRAEIDAQMAAHKAHTGTLENRAHETWVALRQSERRCEEARIESTALRRKLTSLAGGASNNPNDPNHGIIGPGADLNMAPSPIHLDSIGPPLLGHLPPPPFLPPPFMGPPPPYLNMPPPFLPSGELRPPPLGRMMSPPPPLGGGSGSGGSGNDRRHHHHDVPRRRRRSPSRGNYEDDYDYDDDDDFDDDDDDDDDDDEEDEVSRRGGRRPTRRGSTESWRRSHSPAARTYRSHSPADSRYDYSVDRDLMSTYDTETDFSPPPSPRGRSGRGGYGGGGGGVGGSGGGGGGPKAYSPPLDASSPINDNHNNRWNSSNRKKGPSSGSDKSSFSTKHERKAGWMV